MKGKDWFIVGTRLLGLVLLYVGIQEVLIYRLGDMLFAKLDGPFSPRLPFSWSRLFQGCVNVVIGVLALTKAGRFADWCYARDRREAVDGDEERLVGESYQALSAKPENDLVAKLTPEQKDLLIRLGAPDDGTPMDLTPGGERILQELVDRGLVYFTDEESYDLTGEGERVYEVLAFAPASSNRSGDGGT